MRLFIRFSSYLDLDQSDHQIASAINFRTTLQKMMMSTPSNPVAPVPGGGGTTGDMQQLLTMTAANSSAAFLNLVLMYK